MQALLSLFKFYSAHSADELLVDDIYEIENWGLAYRENKPVLLIIDAGYSE